ncbi:MAG TPA: galactokinase family protein [Solirubrobacteraceae bacterium]|nr:galactokinase family protein [Solirubrobacteraceae bacterium]
MSRKSVVAFAPGRVNLIGEHTDYNQGLALPFAIAEGVTVRAQATGEERILARALDCGEQDEFALAEPSRAPGWRAYVRGVVAELGRAGHPLVGTQLEIGGDLQQGAGLSSSAALEVAMCLALLALIGEAGTDRVGLARLCSRVESEWVGAHTGMLDQLASLYGVSGMAMRIDFQTFEVEPVPLRLEDGWRLVTLDSGERHTNAGSAYNQRRAECSEACELLGVDSLRQASWDALEGLPERLRLRARHVLSENLRVKDTVDALRTGDLLAVGHLLNASHASLRDQYDVSTPAVEATVERLLRAGAAGARIVGGGFGGHVLGLLAADVHVPEGVREVRASQGARLLNRHSMC